PMNRGIFSTIYVRGLDRSPQDLHALLAEAYADEPFVHLLPEGTWPTTAATLGGNAVHLQVTVDADAGRLVVVSAVDNLTKGTAGAAIQSMNLAIGLPETTGLSAVGIAP
ncbi:MAG TPA: Asd/ArgC dimerization domain-containing protein, partial [Pseudonocardiaceae bacterium]|nr:Asd/ArgC dimerization domain-containing protein [Pseudonocardiaceae bacterium]